MVTKIMKWVFITVLLLLGLLWPRSAGYQILPGFVAVCAGAILAAQASRAGKYLREAGYTMVSRKVKYEN